MYLTFDDGPGVYTPQILSELAAKVRPRRSSSRASTWRSSRAWCNKNTPTVTGSGTTAGVTGPHRIAARAGTPGLESTAVEIASLTGTRPTLWRPPFGAFNDTVTAIASSLGLSMRLWDVNPADFECPAPARSSAVSSTT